MILESGSEVSGAHPKRPKEGVQQQASPMSIQPMAGYTTSPNFFYKLCHLKAEHFAIQGKPRSEWREKGLTRASVKTSLKYVTSHVFVSICPCMTFSDSPIWICNRSDKVHDVLTGKSQPGGIMQRYRHCDHDWIRYDSSITECNVLSCFRYVQTKYTFCSCVT